MDGNWITTELGTFNTEENTANFIRAFKRQSKGVKFLPYFNYGPPTRYVYVYYDGETFPRGVIGYGTWGSIKELAREKYTIVSRRIANNKFAIDKGQHLMVATEKLDVAISNANTYLLQHNAVEIAKRFKTEMWEAQNTAISRAEDKLKEARTELLFGRGNFNRLTNADLDRVTNNLLSEVLPALDMYAEGRAERNTQDAAWHQNLRKVSERKKDYEREAIRCKATWCVYVQVREWGVAYKVARIPSIESYGVHRIPDGLWDDKQLNLVPEAWYNDSDIADRQWLIGKLAVAETLSIRQYVPNIGYKIAANVFYIEEVESDITR
jgi:hypothetical protein